MTVPYEPPNVKARPRPTVGNATIINQLAGAVNTPPAAAGFAAYPKINMGKPTVDHHAIRAVVGHMGAVQSPQDQAKAMIDAEIAKIEAQITGSYTSQATAGAKAIQSLTAQYAAQMGQLPSQIQGIYAPAEQATAATNAALADRLSGAGNDAADSLASRLASIQEPGVTGAAADALRTSGAGAGNALYATGNASLDQLIANAASGQAYAAKQPGIARLAGLQNLAGFEGSVAAAQGKDLAALHEKEPGLIQQAMATLTSASNAQAARDQSARQFNTREWQQTMDRRATNTRAAATNAERRREFGITQAGKAAAAKVTAADKAATAAAKKTAAQATANYRAAQLKISRRGLTDAERKAALDTINKFGIDQTTGQLTAAGSAELAKWGITVAAGTQLKAVKTAAPKVVGSSATGLWQIDPATGQWTEKVPPVVKPVKPPAPKGTDATASKASGFVMHRDPQGQLVYDTVNGKKIPYKTGSSSTGVKAKALQSATSTARTVITSNLAKTTTYTTQPKVDAFGGIIRGPDGKPVMARTATGTRAKGTYYSSIHQVEANVTPILAPAGYSEEDIIRFSQKLVNSYVKPGQLGRPGKG